MKVAVVIPYYQGNETITECISSLVTCRSEFSELVVVDNCPDGFPEQLLARNWPTLPATVLTAQAGIGFARACNIGLHFAGSNGFDVVVLLNQDAKVTPGCLSRLVKPLTGEIGATFPLSLTWDLTDILPKYVSVYVCRNTQLVTDLVMGRTKEGYDVNADGTNAACAALRVGILAQSGYFDPLFQMYGEERELLHRMKKAGYRLWVIPEARIGHLHSNYSKQGAERRPIDVSIRTGRQIFALKHANKSLVRSIWSCIHLSVKSYFSMLKQRRRRLMLLFLMADLKLITRLGKILRHRSQKLTQEAALAQIKADLRARPAVDAKSAS